MYAYVSGNPLKYIDPMGLDAETGLHQNWFRDYDPSIGRYVQSDPIGLRGGLSTYSYAYSNPVTEGDPLGLDPGLIFDSQGQAQLSVLADLERARQSQKQAEVAAGKVQECVSKCVAGKQLQGALLSYGIIKTGDVAFTYLHPKYGLPLSISSAYVIKRAGPIVAAAGVYNDITDCAKDCENSCP